MSDTQQFTTKKISDLANATTPLSGTELFAIEQGGAARKLAMDALQSLIASVDWGDITGKPTFATVATSGSYNDLSNKPAIPTVPTNVSAFTNDAGYLTSAVTSFNGNTGAVTYTAPVTSVNGKTGAVTGLQTTSNLVTSVSSASTNAQYPSAKLFYDTVGNIETLLASI